MYHWIIFRSACPELFYNCNKKTIKYWYHASCPSTSEEYIDINAEITCGYLKIDVHFLILDLIAKKNVLEKLLEQCNQKEQ